MKWLLITVIGPALVIARPESNNPFRNADKWIEEVNSNPNSTWRAGRNFNPNLPRSFIKSLIGSRTRKSNDILPRGEPITDITYKDIPKTFDARKKWSYCKSLQQIKDQGNCGSSWAVATASAFADRLCVASHGKINNHYSQEQLLDCCPECGDCHEGLPSRAWNYIQTHGVATGGDYGSNDGCQPYLIKPCEHNVTGQRPSCQSMGPQFPSKCRSECTNKKYPKPFKDDLKKVISAYTIIKAVEAMQMEIMTYGPIVADIFLYENFLNYKSGVYVQDSSPFLGYHSIKLIGWGVENGVDYWLAQNSWNDDWGDNGLFKIRRGNNECTVESEPTAGIPIV